MKQLIFAILTGSLIVLAAQSGSGQAAGPGTPVKSISPAALPLLALNDAELSLGNAGQYRPEIDYKGGFEKNKLYKKRCNTDYWRGNLKPAFVQKVKCPEAADRLLRGTWTGNLNKDGSCGSPNEPAEWASGNYLNFLMPEEGE